MKGKDKLVWLMKRRLPFTRGIIRQVVTVLFEEIVNLVFRDEEELVIRDFGKFVCRKTPARKRFIPGKGLVEVPGKKALRFVPSSKYSVEDADDHD